MSDIVRDPYGNPLNRDKLITALRAENERLRAALEHAASDLDDWGAYTKANAARAALEETNDE